MSLWHIAASFVLVWIAEKVGVANNFPLGGATGLLVTLVFFASFTHSQYWLKRDFRKILRQEMGKRD